MAQEISILDLDDSGRRAVNTAAALAQEQIKYAIAIARSTWPAQQDPDPLLISALVQAIAINFAAVK
jgi:hypothetical protein